MPRALTFVGNDKQETNLNGVNWVDKTIVIYVFKLSAENRRTIRLIMI